MYHLLPSEVASKATTFDIQVMEISLAWEQQKINELDGNVKVKQPTEEEMFAMIESTRPK